MGLLFTILKKLQFLNVGEIVQQEGIDLHEFKPWKGYALDVKDGDSSPKQKKSAGWGDVNGAKEVEC